MLFIKARRLKVELHRLDRKKWHNRPWQKKQPEERQESPCLQSWCYLQVACWASLQTKNPIWPKSHKTHFQVAITFAYACPCRIILECVFLAILVSFSLFFFFLPAGVWVNTLFLLPLWSGWCPGCCVAGCDGCWDFPSHLGGTCKRLCLSLETPWSSALAHGTFVVVFQWCQCSSYNGIAPCAREKH